VIWKGILQGERKQSSYDHLNGKLEDIKIHFSVKRNKAIQMPVLKII
jgi:hypothetical protein